MIWVAVALFALGTGMLALALWQIRRDPAGWETEQEKLRVAVNEMQAEVGKALLPVVDRTLRQLDDWLARAKR